MEAEIKAMSKQRSREEAMRRNMANADTPEAIITAIEQQQSN